MAIKVCAKFAGYYGEYREPGDEFEIQDEKHFSKNWMTKVDAEETKSKSSKANKPSKSEASKMSDNDVI